jgi:mono/diheme cytochrome c family protein
MKISRLVSPLLYLLLIPAVVLAGDGEKVAALDANNCAPAGDLRGDPANGQVLHVEHCAACHGLTGQADVVVMHMDETPPDQSDPEYMKNLPDPYLYLAICKGGEGIGKSYVMSPWGDFFSDQEIRDLIGWMRTFSAT